MTEEPSRDVEIKERGAVGGEGEDRGERAELRPGSARSARAIVKIRGDGESRCGGGDPRIEVDREEGGGVAWRRFPSEARSFVERLGGLWRDNAVPNYVFLFCFLQWIGPTD